MSQQEHNEQPTPLPAAQDFDAHPPQRIAELVEAGEHIGEPGFGDRRR
jgi:hypothetical protein